MNTLLDVTATSVVFATNRRNDVDMDVVVRDLTTGEERVVYDGGGYVASTEVSHDEKSVAVTMISLRPSSTSIVLADGHRVAASVTDPDEQADHHVAGWTADDAALVLTSDHDREFHAVLRLDADGTWTSLVEADDHDVSARLSPDGSLMVVGHHVDGLDRLAVHRADGTHVTDVDLDPVVPVSVVWAPDSSAFAVTAVTPTDPGSIVRVDAAHRCRHRARRRSRRRPGRAPRPAGDPDRPPRSGTGRRADPVLPVRRARQHQRGAR